jgi:hypothetical protein
MLEFGGIAIDSEEAYSGGRARWLCLAIEVYCFRESKGGVENVLPLVMRMSSSDLTQLVRAIGCDDVQENRPVIESALPYIRKYVYYELGRDPVDFLKDVMRFYEESPLHYLRATLRDWIAAYLRETKNDKLDMNLEGDRRKVWEEVACFLNVDKSTRSRWLDGSIDPPLDKIHLYLSTSECPRPKSELTEFEDKAALVRMAVARTLTYVRVFPPGPSRARVPRETPELLNRCWRAIVRHPHYRRSKSQNLNQHCLDRIKDRFKDDIYVGESTLGALKARMEDSPTTADTLFWPWVIFKALTLGKSPHNRIWNAKFSLYSAIWEDVS